MLATAQLHVSLCPCSGLVYTLLQSIRSYATMVTGATFMKPPQSKADPIAAAGLAACRQWCDVYSVSIPDNIQLPVTEQLIRSWAAAAGQLTVQITVLPAAATAEAGKKPATPAGKGTPAAAALPPPVASGTLQLNCAGLLVGDTAAQYSWSRKATAPLAQQLLLPEAVIALGAATADIDTSKTSCALARHQSLEKQDQQACPASPPVKSSTPCQQHRKAAQQPPGGNLEDWLGEAHVQLQVRPTLPVSCVVVFGTCRNTVLLYLLL